MSIFYRDTDYFSPIADMKPLLHIWSLGVEEQFYIFVPLLLAFLRRKLKSEALPIIAILSLGLAIAANRMGAENAGVLPSANPRMGIGRGCDPGHASHDVRPARR